MKYKCLNPECGKQFNFAAKKTFEKTECDASTTTIIETVVCPYCDSLNFDELPQEAKGINLADVESYKDVAPNEVDDYLKQGYTIYQSWQKNVHLIKKAKEETQQ